MSTFDHVWTFLQTFTFTFLLRLNLGTQNQNLCTPTTAPVFSIRLTIQVEKSSVLFNDNTCTFLLE